MGLGGEVPALADEHVRIYLTEGETSKPEKTNA